VAIVSLIVFVCCFHRHQTDDGRWAHVICALWIPETQFGNAMFREPISGVSEIPKARFKFNCYICGRNHCGASIQCAKTKCYTAFHVTCAQRARLAMCTTESPESADSDDATLHAYCDLHTPEV
jgi:bromodomain and PHD finger-containing protein 1